MIHQEAFEQLFKDHYEDGVRFGCSFVNHPADAEELVQEVFLKFWERRADLDIATSPKAYLFAAIRNKALETIRKQKKLPSILAEENIDHHSFFIHTIPSENKELEGLLQQAVNNLPPKCREVFLLSRRRQLSYKQIAEKLDISVKTVENQIGKALKLLLEAAKPLLFLLFFFKP